MCYRYCLRLLLQYCEKNWGGNGIFLQGAFFAHMDRIVLSFSKSYYYFLLGNLIKSPFLFLFFFFIKGQTLKLMWEWWLLVSKCSRVAVCLKPIVGLISPLTRRAFPFGWPTGLAAHAGDWGLSPCGLQWCHDPNGFPCRRRSKGVAYSRIARPEATQATWLPIQKTQVQIQVLRRLYLFSLFCPHQMHFLHLWSCDFQGNFLGQF